MVTDSEWGRLTVRRVVVVTGRSCLGHFVPSAGAG